MKKNVLLLLILIVLGAAAWFSWQKAARKSTLQKIDLNFSVSDTSSIDRILIEPVKGPVSDLRRDEQGGWVINKKFRVYPVLMELLLGTIRNLEMLRPLAKNEVATAIESMEKRGRKVTIFVGGIKYKTLWLGDDAPGYKGTYMKLEEGNPYVVFLRGMNGFLSPRFNADENKWRDLLLISLRPDQIKSITLSYKRMPSEGFSLEVADRKIRLAGTATFDTAAAAQVLAAFKKVYAENYLPKYSQKKADSLLASGPEFTMELIGIEESNNKKILMYPTSDKDRTLAYIPASKEWLTIQNHALNKIMQRRSSLLNP